MSSGFFEGIPTRHYAHAVHGKHAIDATPINTLPEQLFCHPSDLTAAWYILRTKVEQLHSDFANIWKTN